MALAEAILVCLTDRPMTGYELAKTFDSSIGFFWNAGHQQIYRELQRLRGDGFVDSEEVIQTSRPNKTIYSITKAGLNHIRQWSTVQTERPLARDNMLVKLYALDCVDVEALRSEISARLAKHESRLELYEHILAKKFQGKNKELRETGLFLGLKFGLMTERGLISWCKDALSTIAKVHDDKPKAGAWSADASLRPANRRLARKRRAGGKL